jgi:Rrf2 family protein
LKTLSKKTKYGLHALYSLSRKYGQGPVLIASMAQEENIPVKFLEQILLQMKEAGLVESKRGKRGGYQLSLAPTEITVGRVVRVIEGPLALLPCASESAFRRCDECPDAAECGTRWVMRQVRDATAAILDGTTLADVVREIDQAREAKGSKANLMYYI